MNVRDFPAITKLVDDGIVKEVEKEIENYNTKVPDRYPLSPSGIGKCALALARNLAHYHGIAKYPRNVAALPPRLYRIFQRGNLLEDALIADFEKYTHLKLKLKQQRVHLFDVHADVIESDGARINRPQPIEGDIDGLVVCEQSGFRILVDFKSKGVRYSQGFSDSFSEMLAEMVQTGLVEDRGNNLYFVSDIKALVDVWSADDFFMDYMLQLNSYAFSDWFKRTGLHGVSLYYENKNTCANYEVRWVPDVRLFDYARDKFQYIYSTTFTSGPEAVQREFNAGSTKCYLCDYNELCNGRFEKNVQRIGSNAQELGLADAYEEYKKCLNSERVKEKLETKILSTMEQKDLTVITMPDGLRYERKFLKTPKPHHELRLCK